MVRSTITTYYSKTVLIFYNHSVLLIPNNKWKSKMRGPKKGLRRLSDLIDRSKTVSLAIKGISQQVVAVAIIIIGHYKLLVHLMPSTNS